jgi:hypothetical protein
MKNQAVDQVNLRRKFSAERHGILTQLFQLQARSRKNVRIESIQSARSAVLFLHFVIAVTVAMRATWQ